MTTRDHTLGLVYLNNRYHDPTLGSFISVDPLVTMTGEAYIYGAANPITYSDPSGLDPDTSSYARERRGSGSCLYSERYSGCGDPSATWYQYGAGPSRWPKGERIESIGYGGPVGPAGNAYDAAGAAFDIDPGVLMFLDDKETAGLIEALLTLFGDPFDPVGGPLDVSSFGPLNIQPGTALEVISSSSVLQERFPGLAADATQRQILEESILEDREQAVWIAAAILDRNRGIVSGWSADGLIGNEVFTRDEYALLLYRYGTDTVQRIATGASLQGPNVAGEVSTWRAASSRW